MNEEIQTGGTADSLAPASGAGGIDSLTGLLQAGGPVVMILIIMSVIALAIALVKLWQFARSQIGARGFVDEALGHWQFGRAGAALDVLSKYRNPIARVMAIAIRARSKGEADEHLIREETVRVASAELEKLRSHLRGLELIGSLSPLLGLLGTVLGMITAFQELQVAGSQVDPTALSGGIWEALLTTAVGLIVAIPAVTILTGLERTIERLHHRMEDAVTRVFTVNLREDAPERSGALSLRAAAAAERA